MPEEIWNPLLCLQSSECVVDTSHPCKQMLVSCWLTTLPSLPADCYLDGTSLMTWKNPARAVFLN